MFKKALIFGILAFVFSASSASAQTAVPRGGTAVPRTGTPSYTEGYAVPRTPYYTGGVAVPRYPIAAPYANYGRYGNIYVSNNNYSSATSGSYHVSAPGPQLWGYSDPSRGYTVSAPAPQLWGYSDPSRGYTVSAPAPQLWGQSDPSKAYTVSAPAPQLWGNAPTGSYGQNTATNQPYTSSASFSGYGAIPVQVPYTADGTQVNHYGQ